MGKLKNVTFPELPVHDTMWSITTGKDGKIYIGMCGEISGGLSVFLVSYSPQEDEVEYIAEISKLFGESPENGKAPYSKIHYSLVPSSNNKLYGATHVSGPPVDDPEWRPWNTWDDPNKMHSGFHIFSYDTQTEEFVDFGMQSENEGCRAMALAEKRNLLYGITYPRCHLFVFDLKEQTYKDMGRIGDMNPQSIWVDLNENACTIDDQGYLVKYLADENSLVHTDIRLPFPYIDKVPALTIYDTVNSPDWESIYGVTWGSGRKTFQNRLFRYNQREESMEDLGPVGEDAPNAKPWHAGGLVFDKDGFFYFAIGRTGSSKLVDSSIGEMTLYRMDPETLKKEKVTVVSDEKGRVSPYLAHATRDYEGRLYFGEVDYRPPRLFVYSPDCKDKGKLSWPVTKLWG